MSDNTQPIYVVMAQNEQDFLRNEVAMLKEENGQLVIHRKIKVDQIIDGEDLIVSEGYVS
jgi:hypothetical protein